MIEEMVKLKAIADDATANYKAAMTKIMANMNSSGIKTDEVPHVAKVTITCQSITDKAACETVPEWVEIKSKEAVLATQRKEIEKLYKTQGAPFLKVTIKA